MGLSVCVALDPQEEHHARRVLRMSDGDIVELFDGNGRIATGRLQRDRVLISRVCRIGPPTPAIDVAVPMPKGSRGEHMIPMLSQLGAAGVIPLRTARSIVHPGETKLSRFAKLAVESAKQCGRAHLMAVSPVTDLARVVGGSHDLRLIAHPLGDGTHSAPVRPQQLAACKTVLLLIGPEGGWTRQELALAKENRCVAISIARHVLRVETAAPAALAILQYLCGSAL